MNKAAASRHAGCESLRSEPLATPVRSWSVLHHAPVFHLPQLP